MLCQICLEDYDELVTLDKINKNCGHKFCEGCLIIYLDHKKNMTQIICPICRINHPIIKWNETFVTTQSYQVLVWLARLSVILASLALAWNCQLLVDMAKAGIGKRSIILFGAYTGIRILDIIWQLKWLLSHQIDATQLFRSVITNMIYVIIIVMGNVGWDIMDSYNLFNLIMASECISLIVFEIVRYVFEIDKIDFCQPTNSYYKIGDTEINIKN